MTLIAESWVRTKVSVDLGGECRLFSILFRVRSLHSNGSNLVCGARYAGDWYYIAWQQRHTRYAYGAANTEASS